MNHVAAATADAFIFSTYSLNSYQVEPAALIQEDQMIVYGLADKENFESTIGRSEHFKPEFSSINEKTHSYLYRPHFVKYFFERVSERAIGKVRGCSCFVAGRGVGANWREGRSAYCGCGYGAAYFDIEGCGVAV